MLCYEDISNCAPDYECEWDEQEKMLLGRMMHCLSKSAAGQMGGLLQLLQARHKSYSKYEQEK